MGSRSLWANRSARQHPTERTASTQALRGVRTGTSTMLARGIRLRRTHETRTGGTFDRAALGARSWRASMPVRYSGIGGPTTWSP